VKWNEVLVSGPRLTDLMRYLETEEISQDSSADIRPPHVPNTSQKLYHVSQPVRSITFWEQNLSAALQDMAAAHLHLLALWNANDNSFFVTVYHSKGYGLCIGHSAVKKIGNRLWVFVDGHFALKLSLHDSTPTNTIVCDSS